MAATSQDTVRSYTADLLAVLRHCHGAILRHVDDEQVRRISNAGPLLRDMDAKLARQIAALERRLEELGGAGAVGSAKEMVTSVSGFLAGIYGKMRGEKASRMLRDDYVALNFMTVCATMLHTTALALADARTAELTKGFLNDYPPLIMELGELVPHAVIADLGADEIAISDSQAGLRAAEELREAWQAAPHSGSTAAAPRY